MTINNLQSKVEILEAKLVESHKLSSTEDEISGIKEMNAELETQIADASQENKMIKSQFEKQIAIFNQKISFYETQLNEAKIQQEEGQKVHEALLKAFKSMEAEKDFSKDNVHDMIQKQRSEYIEEIANIQSKFEETKSRLTDQVEKLSQQNNTLELNYKIRISEVENDNLQLTQQIEELIKSKSMLSENLKIIESDKIQLIDTLEAQYKEKIKSLENELNERNTSNQEFIDQHARGTFFRSDAAERFL